MTANAGNKEIGPCQDSQVRPMNISMNPAADTCCEVLLCSRPENVVLKAVMAIVNPAVQAESKTYCIAHSTAANADQRRKSC